MLNNIQNVCELRSDGLFLFVRGVQRKVVKRGANEFALYSRRENRILSSLRKTRAGILRE